MPVRATNHKYEGSIAGLIAVVEAALSLVPADRKSHIVPFNDIEARLDSILPRNRRMNSEEILSALAFAFPLYKNNRSRNRHIKLDVDTPYRTFQKYGIHMQPLEHIRKMI